MKNLKIIKTVLYMLGGVAVLILNNLIMERQFVGYLVGMVIAFYALDIVIVSVAEKRALGEDGVFMALTHALLSVVLFLVADDIVKICLVWAVWSILREGKELSECIHRISHKKMGILNAVESIVIIVFSFTMILEPGEHHAHVHVIILGIELMLEVIFPIMNGFFDSYAERKKLAATQNGDKKEE